MKRNKLFIAGLVTVFVALCSLTLVSSTWAKYTSTATGSDTARVAYWGFDGDAASMTLTGLFKTSYTNVVSKDTSNVIAPGTEGEKSFAFSYDATGAAAPEVAYQITVSTAGSQIDDAIKNNSNIKWSLDSNADEDFGTWETLMADILALSGHASGTAQHNAGSLAGISSTHTIYWKWVFETKTGGVVDSTQDDADTAMGIKDALDDVTIQITVTATQVD